MKNKVLLETTSRVFARQISRELNEEESIQVAGGKRRSLKPNPSQNPNQFQNAGPFNIGESKPNGQPTDDDKCWKTDQGGFFALDCKL